MTIIAWAAKKEMEDLDRDLDRQIEEFTRQYEQAPPTTFDRRLVYQAMKQAHIFRIIHDTWASRYLAR